MVEGRFIFQTALSRHLLPFITLHPAWVVLPIENRDGVLSVVESDKLKKDGYREFGKWMEKVEGLWAAKRGEKADNETVYGWLDYQGKLTAQNLHHRHLVLYNAAGTNVSAAYFDRQQHPRFVVENKLYCAAFSNPREAHYVWRSESKTANERIKPFQSTGLMGERDIERNFLSFQSRPLTMRTPSMKALRSLESPRGRRQQGSCSPPSFRRRHPRQRSVA